MSTGMAARALVILSGGVGKSCANEARMTLPAGSGPADDPAATNCIAARPRRAAPRKMIFIRAFIMSMLLRQSVREGRDEADHGQRDRPQLDVKFR
jgi:hypothetical protein